MFQEILEILPKQAGLGAALAIGIGALLGLVLWSAGSRYNRMIMALAGVTAGGLLGMTMPRLMGWDLNAMAVSLSFALVVGVIAFAMPRLGVAMGMAALLAAWASVAVWMLYHGSAKLALPAKSDGWTAFWSTLWKQLPELVRLRLPLAAGIAAAMGVLLTLVLRRTTTAIFYSATGVSALLVAGLWAVRCENVDWTRFLPAGTAMQAMLLAGLVALGVVLQLVIMPIRRKLAARDAHDEPSARPSHAQ